jgi:hypothetical protein
MMPTKPCRTCGDPVEYDERIPPEFVAAAQCVKHAWVRQPVVFVVTPTR